MLLCVILCVVTCVMLIACVLIKPVANLRGHSVALYVLPPVVGAISLIAAGCISLPEVFEGLTRDSEVNPIKILILFFSMTLISVILDEAGFFLWLASAVMKRAGHSKIRIFMILYITVSVLTVFTSNDIIVLTFTPFLCFFCKNAKIDPIPFLFCEFVAANTWSMALIIGNPTNIYLCSSAGADFMGYIKVMILPTLVAGTVSMCMLLLVFKKKLFERANELHTECAEPVTLADKPTTALALIFLSLCVVTLSISSFLSLPMWIIALSFFIGLYLSVFAETRVRHKSEDILGRSVKRAPFEMIPFVISMFVLVLALEKCGATAAICGFLSKNNVFSYGIASFFSANLINNIPMSVLFSSVATGVTENAAGALYASVIGSNLGAFLTPLGALAGIMWTGMLTTYGVKLSFAKFVKYGTAVSVPTLLTSLCALYVVI